MHSFKLMMRHFLVPIASDDPPYEQLQYQDEINPEYESLDQHQVAYNYPHNTMTSLPNIQQLHVSSQHSFSHQSMSQKGVHALSSAPDHVESLYSVPATRKIIDDTNARGTHVSGVAAQQAHASAPFLRGGGTFENATTSSAELDRIVAANRQRVMEQGNGQCCIFFGIIYVRNI